jgi:hypothetical protein
MLLSFYGRQEKTAPASGAFQKNHPKIFSCLPAFLRGSFLDLRLCAFMCGSGIPGRISAEATHGLECRANFRVRPKMGSYSWSGP